MCTVPFLKRNALASARQVNLMGTWTRDTVECIWLNAWEEGPQRKPRAFRGKLANRSITGTLDDTPFKELNILLLLQSFV
jgi:hypothetical protein